MQHPVFQNYDGNIVALFTRQYIKSKASIGNILYLSGKATKTTLNGIELQLYI
jgi:hypothetical protein